MVIPRVGKTLLVQSPWGAQEQVVIATRAQVGRI
jgi:hypothetical protein